MTIMDGAALALLVELEAATTEIINRHFDNDEKRDEQHLRHYGSFAVRIYTDNGLTASFMEEGIDLYPKETP